MMTATAAMGIAVDDTLHYLTWYRRGLSGGKSRHEAVLFAYERCGTAMIQTTLICGFGLVVFALSPFGPIMHFALMMFSMLFAAILGDLIVLPALLLTPLGRVFDRRREAAKFASPIPQGSPK
jgi:predicted RND superfamily exporter protein